MLNLDEIRAGLRVRPVFTTHLILNPEKLNIPKSIKKWCDTDIYAMKLVVDNDEMRDFHSEVRSEVVEIEYC